MAGGGLKIFSDIPKRMFFDRDPVLKAIDAANRRVLSKIGAFVRTRAQTSMKRRRASAKPNQPPSAHGNPLLKKLLYFAFDAATKSVVVGPVRSRKGVVPHLMEYGGQGEVIVRGVKTTRRFAPHAFMGPALAKEREGFAKLWKDQVKRG
jgi:hypothetical protein